MRHLWLSALILVAAACGSSNPTAAHNPSHAIACARGSLTLDAPLSGDLDPASTCKPLSASYSLSVQSGHGYLIAMGGQHLHPVLELISPGGDTLRAASPTYLGPPSIARMLIASRVTETDTVRVTTFDTLASDTGAFLITAQACKVPVAPLVQTTDSVTHADTVSGGDCQVDLSDFLDELHAGQVYVQLYALHFGSGNYRQITIDASSPVWLFMGGPKNDAFGALPGDGVESIDTATTHTVNNFGRGAGDFTLVVAAPTLATYSLTIGAEHPFPSVTRFSRSRSHPPAALHRSTPLSVMRRGR